MTEGRGTLSPAVSTEKNQSRVSNVEQSHSSSPCTDAQECVMTAQVHNSCSNISTCASSSLTNPRKQHNFLEKDLSHTVHDWIISEQGQSEGFQLSFQEEYMCLVSQALQTSWDIHVSVVQEFPRSAITEVLLTSGLMESSGFFSHPVKFANSL